MEALQATKIVAPRGIDVDEDGFRDFVDDCMSAVEEQISYNADSEVMFEETPSTDEILREDNIRSIEVRSSQLDNPSVKVWLFDAPDHAVDAWRQDVTTFGLGIFRTSVPVSFGVDTF
jgi:hypothetical protein